MYSECSVNDSLLHLPLSVIVVVFLSLGQHIEKCKNISANMVFSQHHCIAALENNKEKNVGNGIILG